MKKYDLTINKILRPGKSKGFASGRHSGRTIMSHCNLCGGRESEPLWTITRFEKPFAIHRCPRCGLVFMRPFFSDAELAAMYGEEYYTDKAPSGTYTYTDERLNPSGYRSVNRARIRMIAKFLPRNSGPRHFLDIGCSFGALVDEAARAGFTASGLDISEYAVATARTRGLDVRQGTPDAIPDFGHRFHAVTMIEVIEHLADPRRALEEIARVLEPGGIVVIQTANMDGRQAVRAGAGYHYFLPGHLHYFSRRTLAALLAATGFGDLKVFHPCEFGLVPKLRKSRGTFRRLRDYGKWFRIALYHWKSKFHWRDRALTSGMVIYARKL